MTKRMNSVNGISPEEMKVLNREWEEKVAAYAKKNSLTIKEASRAPVKRRGKVNLRPNKASKTSEKKSKPKKPKPKKPTILSKRGRRINGVRSCDKCHCWFSVTWRLKSTAGELHVCGTCKQIMLKRDGHKMDAMDRAISGGSFESNRRRH